MSEEQTTKTKRISAHLTPATLEACGIADGLSAGLNRIADRYRAMVDSAHIEAQFTPAEWDLIREALNGWQAEPAETIRGGPALEVGDAMEELAGKYDVDGHGLVARLCSLSYPEEVALVDAVERYWRDVAAAQEGRG